MPDQMVSPLDAASERASRRLASRHSRRSFLGGLGGAGLAVVGTSVWGTAEAQANACGCGGSAATCNDYWGNNSCPPWTCECGFWDLCGGTTSPCGGSTPIKRWRDCCDGQCNDYRCYGGAPSCCNNKIYSGGCGTLNQTKIRCRYWTCHTTAAC